MNAKEIENWAKPVVDGEVDSEMYSRLSARYNNGELPAKMAEELSPSYNFADAVYVESLLAAAYFFQMHGAGENANSIYYNCKRMIESGMPIVAMKELGAGGDFLKTYAQNIRLFYEKVLSENFGPLNEESPFAILERHYCG
ncbi:MAG: hypothetical protein IT269_05630 [Saprospiraceae bacterium]|nr:hypothetical protein [Saprospiraceae bacterium]